MALRARHALSTYLPLWQRTSGEANNSTPKTAAKISFVELLILHCLHRLKVITHQLEQLGCRLHFAMSTR